jgi:hypothetical protein
MRQVVMFTSCPLLKWPMTATGIANECMPMTFHQPEYTEDT